MKVIVYQSYSGPPPPPWLARCRATVEAWAADQGYDYDGDNDLYAFVPDWYGEKAGPFINVVADLARLTMARHYLDQGYDRAIWLDADVVVFDPDRFRTDLAQSCLLCGEVWLDTDPNVDFGAGDLHCKRQVTNSLTMFAPDNTFLDAYIERCLAIVRDGPHPAPRLSVSTHLLTSLAKTMTFPLVHDLALISPILMLGIAESDPTILDLYASYMAAPVRAANLCLSFRGKRDKGIPVTDALFDRTIDKLLETQGHDINRAYHHRSYARSAPRVRGLKKA